MPMVSGSWSTANKVTECYLQKDTIIGKFASSQVRHHLAGLDAHRTTTITGKYLGTTIKAAPVQSAEMTGNVWLELGAEMACRHNGLRSMACKCASWRNAAALLGFNYCEARAHEGGSFPIVAIGWGCPRQ
ncbi:MAG: hypothetical protein FRX49_04471 [Trebouxia sp. A1-2]|nr:MAG: hypothetical protein FRX49_04471 [Trebouxia sp. A1-2]